VGWKPVFIYWWWWGWWRAGVLSRPGAAGNMMSWGEDHAHTFHTDHGHTNTQTDKQTETLGGTVETVTGNVKQQIRQYMSTKSVATLTDIIFVNYIFIKVHFSTGYIKYIIDPYQLFFCIHLIVKPFTILMALILSAVGFYTQIKIRLCKITDPDIIFIRPFKKA